MAHDVFISYSSEDKPIADAVSAAMEAKHIRCWIAPRDVLPGRDYAEQLIEAISGARLMVLVFSSKSNSSPHVMREVERAASRGIPILPFRIEHVSPSAAMEYYISSTHWLDALTPPLERHLEHLTDTVRLLLERNGKAASLGSAEATEALAAGSRPEGRTAQVKRSRVESDRGESLSWYRRPWGFMVIGAAMAVVIAAVVAAVVLLGSGKSSGTEGGISTTETVPATVVAETSSTIAAPATMTDPQTSTTTLVPTTTLASTTTSSSTTTTASTTTTTQAVVPGTVLYEMTEWTAGAESWPTTGQWKAVDGMLVSDGSQAYVSVALVDLGNVSDYAVEAQMQVVSAKTTGRYYLEARLIGGEGYVGGYKGSSSSSYREMVIGFGSDLISATDYTTDTGWHTYRLEVNGNSVRLLYDGAEMVSGIDNRQLRAGTVGVYASGQLNVRSFRVIAL